MIKHLKILRLFAKISLMDQMAHRPSFVLAIIGKMIRVGTILLFFDFLYRHAYILAGWKQEHAMVLIAVYLTVEFSWSVTFHRNLLFWFPQRLRRGTFDYVLVQPVNALFHTAFRTLDFFDLFSSLPVVALWVHIFITQPVQISILPLVFFFTLVSIAFMFGLTLAIATTAFWTIQATGIGRMTEHAMRIGRYPVDVFSGGWRILFWYVLPVGIIATLPAKIWYGAAEAPYIVYAIFITIVLVASAIAFWRFGLKRYQSASS